MSCIFCEIIKGNIPSLNIYEDDQFIAFLDKFPQTPGHCLEQIFGVDLGQELIKMAEHPYDAEVIKSTVRVPGPDGSYVLGVQMRDLLRKTEAIKSAEDYLDIQFHFYKGEIYQYADYNFKLLRKPVLPARPLEFHVGAYFSVDGILVKEERRVIQARFDKNAKGNPADDFRFRTTTR